MFSVRTNSLSENRLQNKMEDFDEYQTNDFSEDLLNDLLIQLNDRNCRQMDEIDNNCLNLSKFRCSSGVAQNIITVCEIFKLDNCVKYTSIELFDKLMVQLVCDTKRVFLETTQNLSGQQMPFDWTSIEKKLKKQMHLRAVTCVVIAAKLSNSKATEPTTTQIRDFLRSSGYRYSLENINRSELRVLKLLNFKLVVNPIDIYVEILLAVLKFNSFGFECCLQSFRSVATQLLDLYYICRNVIARNALKIMAKRLKFDFTTSDEELEMERIGSNKMLISAAIIASIPIIIDVSIYELIVNELSEICGIDDHLIVDMSHAILILICEP